MTKIKGKRVWITGASSGIGEALANEMAKAGAHLILSARSVNKLEELKASLPKSSEVEVLPFDLADLTACADAVESLKNKGLLPDILINNGGISQRSLTKETSFQVDKDIMQVNYFSAVYLSKLLMPLVENKPIHFVAMSSIAGRFGFPLRSAYSAAKHALVGFYETLALEHWDTDLRVTIVFPGRVQTNISKYALTGDGKLHGNMDKGQADGISATACALDIIKGIEKNKLWVYSGGKELLLWKFYKFWPNLYIKIARKVSAH